MKRLENKTAVVTGAANGIGRAIGRVFAAEGANVALVDIMQDKAEQVAASITSAGGKAMAISADVSNLNEMKRMAEQVLAQYGSIDIVCANAGIFPEATLEQMTEEDWDTVVDINLKGVFLTVTACLPAIKQRESGRILVTSSITGNRTAIPGLSHYAASKAGINGFIRAAAVELARDNITVNGVEPGNILTEGMDEQLGPDYIKAQEEVIPMGRMGDPEDIAYAMLFLASDEAKFITGQTVIVDGGQTLPESKTAVTE